MPPVSNDGIWIMICGGHGAGKTTVLQDIRRECPDGDTYRYVFADSGGALRDDEGKVIKGTGKKHDKYKAPRPIQYSAILDDWNSNVPVIISDGTRIQLAIKNAHQVGLRERKLVAVALYQTPEIMEAHMRARCLRYGKEFNAKFWTQKQLLETGRGEWERFFKRYPKSLNLIEFAIDLEFSVIPEVRRAIRELMAEGKWLAMEYNA
jgi:hypothetical protein